MTDLNEDKFDQLLDELRELTEAKFKEYGISFHTDDVDEQLELFLFKWADRVYTNYN